MYFTSRLITAGFLALFLCIAVVPGYTADDDKPYVHINTASYLGHFSGSNYGMTTFCAIARAHGYDIDHSLISDFGSGAALEDIDIYVHLDPKFLFLPEDRKALRQWIRDGGIFITGQWFLSEPMNGYLQEFGIEIGDMDYSTRPLKLPNGCPLAGPRAIHTLSAQGGRVLNILDSTKAEAIVRYSDGTIAWTRSISNAGKGLIITLGNPRFLYDDQVDGDMGRDDNNKLVGNLFSYFKSFNQQESACDLNLYKLKTKRGTTFVSGEEIKFIARIRNIGTEQGTGTRVAFYIEKIGATPSAKIEVDSANIPAINAKKKIKIVKKAFLPDGLAAGTYEVTAVIDPEELTDDADTDNNSAAAKKKIVIK